MKGNEELIVVLNTLLKDELSAVNQYMVHAKMCQNWGYGKLHTAIRNQAFDEMNHAELLIERIILYENTPTVTNVNMLNIGKTVSDMIDNDNDGEIGAVNSYNSAIRFARSCDDYVTVDILTRILISEESHLDWAETQRNQIQQMGIENYLLSQVEIVNE